MRKKIDGSPVESGPKRYATWATSGPSEPIVLVMMASRWPWWMNPVGTIGIAHYRASVDQASCPIRGGCELETDRCYLRAFSRNLLRTTNAPRTEPGAVSSRTSGETRCRPTCSDSPDLGY